MTAASWIEMKMIKRVWRNGLCSAIMAEQGEQETIKLEEKMTGKKKSKKIELALALELVTLWSQIGP